MNKLLFTIGIVFTMSVSGLGQKESPSASASGQGSGALKVEKVIAIEGQLQKTLDVKNARVGDEVVIKTTRAVKDAGKIIVPKGSKLVGRIVDVQQRTKETNLSRLGVVFDRLEGGGINSDLSGSVVTITNIVAAGSVVDTVDLFGSSNASSSTSARSSRSAPSGGGLLGGATSSAGGLLGGATNTVGNTLGSGAQTVGGVTAAVNQTVGSSAGNVFRTVNGLHISNSTEGSAQAGTTLSATGKNLKVEKGATVRLRLNGEMKEQK